MQNTSDGRMQKKRELDALTIIYYELLNRFRKDEREFSSQLMDSENEAEKRLARTEETKSHTHERIDAFIH